LAKDASDTLVKTAFCDSVTAVQKGHLNNFEQVETHLTARLCQLETVAAEAYIGLLPRFMVRAAKSFSILKITWLMDIIRQSAKAVECSQCGGRFTGLYRAKNLKLHKERSCGVTQKGSEYRRLSCDHCETTFSRMDNLNKHVRRKHHTI
jgi:hypothetical protein